MPHVMQMVLGLGSNLGSRLALLSQAAALIAEVPDTEVTKRSAVYETAPMGPPQPWYLNAAVRIHTTLAPLELWQHLQHIESVCGRVKRERWGPRTLDIDILWAETLQMNDPSLCIPHRGLMERAFALAPLLDVAPELEPTLRGRLAELGGSPRIYCHVW